MPFIYHFKFLQSVLEIAVAALKPRENMTFGWNNALETAYMVRGPVRPRQGNNGEGPKQRLTKTES